MLRPDRASVTVLLLCASTFALDLAVPLGVAAGIPYTGIALLAAFGPRPRRAVAVAALATALIGLGAFLSAAHASAWVVVTNRAMAVASVWIIALLVMALVRTQRARDEARAHVGRVRKLLIPMCAQCRRMRTADDRWRDLVAYLEHAFDAEITHGMCMPCMHELYPELAPRVEERLARPTRTWRRREA